MFQPPEDRLAGGLELGMSSASIVTVGSVLSGE
jgi:hypothetical protein